MQLKATEKDIQKVILEWLTLKKYFCWRNNTGATPFQKKGGGNYFVRYGLVGSGDILGLTKTGRFFSIEVKAPGKKPTESQLNFMQAINENGGLAFTAHCLNDVEIKL